MSPALRQPSFAVLLCCSPGSPSASSWSRIYWTGTAETLLDTDDAMRLVAGTRFPRRPGLVRSARDAGRAAGRLRIPLVAADRCRPRRHCSCCSRLFPSDALAERLMRTVWPMLWLLPDHGWASRPSPGGIAGREAALIALLLAVVGLPAFQQFKPGRIDHHNVQIALACSRRSRRPYGPTACAGPPGRPARLTGLALAIGFECLPYLATCGVAFAIRFIVALDRGRSRCCRCARRLWAVACRRHARGFLVSVGADHWGRSVCDGDRHQPRGTDRDRRAAAGRSGGIAGGRKAGRALRSNCRHRRPHAGAAGRDRAALPGRSLRA